MKYDHVQNSPGLDNRRVAGSLPGHYKETQVFSDLEAVCLQNLVCKLLLSHVETMPLLEARGVEI